MDTNTANDEKKTATSPFDSSQPTTTQHLKKKIARVWYWLMAALLLIVVLIVVLVIINSNHKKERRLSLAEAVSVVNSQTPALGNTMKLDSVTFDREENMVVYHNSILQGTESLMQLMRNYFTNISADDLRVQAIVSFDQDYLAQQIRENQASVRYLYRDTDGRILQNLTLSSDELNQQPSEDKMRHAAQVMIQQEARATQLMAPQKMDEDASITACTFNPDSLQLCFTITLAQPASEIDQAELDHSLAEQKEGVIHALAHDVLYRSSGVTVNYEYLASDGTPLRLLSVTPHDYLNHHHDHHHDE